LPARRTWFEAMDEASERVDAAFAAVPRVGFLPRSERGHVGEDRPIPIGHGQTNSQPTTVRNMLRLLDVRTGERVLDVGSGSGWTCALLAELVGPSGCVNGVELLPDLASAAHQRVLLHGFHWASVEAAEPGVLGLPSRAPYGKILVSAESRTVPDPLVGQLARGGRMVVPVAGRLAVVDVTDRGAVQVRRVGHYAFVPLLWDP
jgi:protein-L-isoaspartate(D-aspartate) O-methyltransferase